MLTMLVAGCVSDRPEPAKPPSENPICIGTRDARDKVASDVGRTADDALAVSAGNLVVLIDAGCAKGGSQ
jgi:hypothetical protein